MTMVTFKINYSSGDAIEIKFDGAENQGERAKQIVDLYQALLGQGDAEQLVQLVQGAASGAAEFSFTAVGGKPMSPVELFQQFGGIGGLASIFGAGSQSASGEASGESASGDDGAQSSGGESFFGRIIDELGIELDKVREQLGLGKNLDAELEGFFEDLEREAQSEEVSEEEEAKWRRLLDAVAGFSLLGLVGLAGALVVRFVGAKAIILTIGAEILMGKLRELFVEEGQNISFPDSVLSQLGKIAEKEHGKEMLREALSPLKSRFSEATREQLIAMGVFSEADFESQPAGANSSPGESSTGDSSAGEPTDSES